MMLPHRRWRPASICLALVMAVAYDGIVVQWSVGAAVGSTAALQCTDDGDNSNTMTCSFSVQKDSNTEMSRSHCDENNFCVHVSVKTSTRGRGPDGMFLQRPGGGATLLLDHRLNYRDTINGVSSIVIGGYAYAEQPSLDVYGPEVARVLRQWQPEWRSVLDEAQFYVELGLAHRNQVENDLLQEENLAPPADGTDVNGGNSSDNANRAIQAFYLALNLYHGLEQQSSFDSGHAEDRLLPSERPHLLQTLATTYFAMGETYAMLRDDDDTQRYLGASGHYEMSANYYKQLLDQAANNAAVQDFFATNPMLRYDVEIGWAHANMRLGVQLVNHYQNDEKMYEATHIRDSEQMTPEEVLDFEEAALAVMANQLLAAQEAEAHFDSAIVVFEAYSAKHANGEMELYQHELLDLQKSLATAFQNRQTAMVLRNDLSAAARAGERSMELYQQLVTHHAKLPSPDHEAELHDLREAMTQVLQSLADIYLQQGLYTESKDRFQRAIELYQQDAALAGSAASLSLLQKKGATGPSRTAMEAADDEMIRNYEKVLQEYNELLPESVDVHEMGGGVDEDPFVDEMTGQEYYQRDDGYEGDLHATLGALYLNVGDVVGARSHMQQAMQLYRKAGEGDDRVMADAQFNLASVCLASGEFAASVEHYNAALDIYHKVVGDGKNPMLPEGIAQDMLDEERQKVRDLAASMAAAQKDLTADNVNTRQSREEATAEKKSSDNGSASRVSDAKKSTIVNEKLIDVNALLKSMNNATKRDVKEEL